VRIDDLQMDMTGVELSVVDAHRQVQRVGDEVVKPLSEKVSTMYQDFFTSGGAMESVRATLRPDASRGDCPIRGRRYLPSGLS
jgi:hypothetical protein